MPKVSVIIPNYNYARYLGQRMRSVLQQTFTDLEVIYLDDASGDNSAEVLATFLPDPRVRVFSNTTNSGSTFIQWNRGLGHCTGEYVWIAEADDYADPRLLATLVDRLDRYREIGVAYCQSWNVDEEGRLLGSNLPYTQGLDAERWKQDYIANGNDECCRALIYMNTIPNASAALFRRRVCQQIGGADPRFRLCGDWLMWIGIALASGVAYVAEPLNYYRSHPRSVRAATTRNGLWIEEMARIIAFLYPRLNMSPEQRARLAEHFWRIWTRACPWRDIPLDRHWKIYRAARTFAPGIGLRVLRGMMRRAGRTPRKVWRLAFSASL
jgi:glycosyltransferase involved in cell wall biosynthesis